MANFTLNWTAPGPLNCTSQTIEYKNVSASGAWISLTSVGPSINTYVATGLADNTIYEFRIQNVCIYGGTVPSITPIQSFKIICPVVTVVPTYSLANGYQVTVNWSVPTGAYLYTTYNFYLLNSTGTSVLNSNLGLTTSSTAVQTFTFSSLSAATTYQIHVDVNLGANVKSNCPNNTFTTASAAECKTPTLISVQPL
jgi:hypothetical protein